MKYDVAIVGAGPVGTTLAALLAKRGLSVVVLERDLDIYPLPRAAHLDAETARNLREIGGWLDTPGWSIANEGMGTTTQSAANTSSGGSLSPSTSSGSRSSGWSAMWTCSTPGTLRPACDSGALVRLRSHRALRSRS